MLDVKQLEALDQQWSSKQWLSDTEFCELAQVSPQTTLRWRKSGKLGFIKTPTGTIRYARRHIEAFERLCESPATA